MKFKKCAVIGLGLIGGSIAAAIKGQQLAGYVVAYTPRQDHLRIAEHFEYIDVGAEDIASCVHHADLVIIAAPVAAFESIFAELSRLPSDWLAVNVIVTDVGSVKGLVLKLAAQYIPHLAFIAGHPIAGSEKSGILAVNPRLFESHLCVLLTHESDTAKSKAKPDDYQKIKQLWENLGAQVVDMPADEHDRVFAATSHLPHLLAFSLVDTLAGDEAQRAIFQFAASGFRDFTRIAASDPVMWHDIFFANKAHILRAIDDFSSGLNMLRATLDEDDHEGILGILTRSQAARKHFQAVLEQRTFTSLRHSTLQQQTSNGVIMAQHTVQHFLLQPGGKCLGEIYIPGDKSISHRSIMFGALAEGETQIHGFLEGEDALATLQAFRDMGVVIEGPKDGEVVVHGVGLYGLKQPKGDIYVGNSGTTIRLLSGLLAAQSFASRMIGDDTIMRRPMARVAEPLTRMGAQVEISEQGTPPVVIRPAGQTLTPIDYTMPVVSAQVKSAILLAGLYADGVTKVQEIGPARDHTERMLKAFGCDIKVSSDRQITLKGQQSLKAIELHVPADISSAAFFLVATSIAKDGESILKNIGMNPTRTGVIEILRLMGADIKVENERIMGGEPVADLHVTGQQLQGIQIPERLVPLAIDEFPAIFIAAACAIGVTKLTGAQELRVKESDRIAAMAEGLKTLGVEAVPQPDGIVIHGKGTDADSAATIFTGGEIDTFGDHRIAMAFTVAALRATKTILVKDIAHVATSFPGFMETAQLAGLAITKI